MAKRAGLMDGWYAVRNAETSLGWSFHKDNQLAQLSAALRGEQVVWVSSEQFTAHMTWWASGAGSPLT